MEKSGQEMEVYTIIKSSNYTHSVEGRASGLKYVFIAPNYARAVRSCTFSSHSNEGTKS